MKKNEFRIWYLYPEDAPTNKRIAIDFNPTERYDVEVEDIVDGKKVVRKLSFMFQLNSYLEVQDINKRKKSAGLEYKIFVQDDPGDVICRWPHDFGLKEEDVKKSKKK